MSVWVIAPSARPVAQVNRWGDRWSVMGYKIALWRDADTGDPDADIVRVAAVYPGYAQAVNALAAHILAIDSECTWIVATGDDTEPDYSKRADQIAAECSQYFGDLWADRPASPDWPIHRHQAETMGVMQPTGDPWSDSKGRIIERIAGSPWLGREWCRRSYGGNGPLYPAYTHCFADEELQLVAQRMGVFWQRTDLTHQHNNWARARGDVADKPDFLTEATSPEHWRKYGDLFRARQAAGFPGSEPIA